MKPSCSWLPRNSSLFAPFAIALLPLLPTYAAGSIDAEKYGQSMGYPLASNEFLSQRDEYIVAEYSGQRFEDGKRHPNFNNEFHWVRAATSRLEIPVTSVKWPSSRDPADWMSRHAVLAVVVYKEGKIIFEKYQYDRHRNNRFAGESMTKTLTAMAVGLAVDEGKLDIDQPVSTYLPELVGTALGKVSVRNHLKMASGSSFVWDSKGDARTYYLNKFASVTCGMDQCGRDIKDVWRGATTSGDQGIRFNYDPQSSDILSGVLQTIYGQRLAKVWEKKVWTKIGAERDAFWRGVRNTPITSGANFFFATSHDWIKLAKLWIEPNAVVSNDWLNQMIIDSLPTANHPQSRWGRSSPDRYGYQLWIRTGRWIAMAGYRGQKLFIDRASKTAMFVSSLEGSWTDEGVTWFEWVSKQSSDSLKRE